MALVAWSFHSKKIDRYFFETFIWVNDILTFVDKYDVKVFGLIFYLVVVNLIYPFFVGSLIAAIE